MAMSLNGVRVGTTDPETGEFVQGNFVPAGGEPTPSGPTKEEKVAERQTRRAEERAKANAQASGQARPQQPQQTQPSPGTQAEKEPKQKQVTSGSPDKGPATAGRDFGPDASNIVNSLGFGRSFATPGSQASARGGMAGAIFSPYSLFSAPGQGRFASTGGGPSNPLGGLARAMVMGGRGGGAPSGALAAPSTGFLGSSVFGGQQQDPQQQLLQMLQQQQF